jgi:hypothetical protein
VRDIPRRLRGTDFRHAVQAIAALRDMDRAEAGRTVPAVDAPDEQRAFQLAAARIVAQSGVRGLAERWHELPGTQWRELFVSEIEQALASWTDEDTVEMVLSALDDEPSVQRRAVTYLRSLASSIPKKAGWMTAPRRARIAVAVTSALERCADNPRDLTWPDWYIDLLGLIAVRGDVRALAILERLRPKAGEPRRTEFERLDPDDLPRETAAVARQKGVPAGTPFVRIKSTGSGLLDLENLERAIAAIKHR